MKLRVVELSLQWNPAGRGMIITEWFSINRAFISAPPTPEYYYDMGKSRGTGTLSFDNPAAADFTLIVYDYKAYVYVDGEFIGEYTLSKDRELSGNFGYGIISGTNHDYGTRCEITNSRMWKLP